jgi:hypothetical protein
MIFLATLSHKINTPDETRADFSRWKGIYETWLRRKQSYTEQINQRELAETLRSFLLSVKVGR